jgi:hypothetical protein
LDDGGQDLKLSIQRTVKERAFLWWQWGFGRNCTLLHTLEDLVYDSVGDSGWFDKDLCEPESWVVSVEQSSDEENLTNCELENE